MRKTSSIREKASSSHRFLLQLRMRRNRESEEENSLNGLEQYGDLSSLLGASTPALSSVLGLEYVGMSRRGSLPCPAVGLCLACLQILYHLSTYIHIASTDAFQQVLHTTCPDDGKRQNGLIDQIG
jgi:hypothetical protein